MDVTKIILTEAEQAAFDLFRQTDSVVLTSEQFRLLAQKNLVQKSVDGAAVWFTGIPDHGECCLSQAGKELRTYQLQQKQAVRRQSRRYWITTGIASLALVLSILSLAWQAYTWHMEQKFSTVSSDYSISHGELGGQPKQ